MLYQTCWISFTSDQPLIITQHR